MEGFKCKHCGKSDYVIWKGLSAMIQTHIRNGIDEDSEVEWGPGVMPLKIECLECGASTFEDFDYEGQEELALPYHHWENEVKFHRKKKEE